MAKPFRFGVQSNGAPSGKAWRDHARKIESLGYSTLYVPDHFGDQWAPEIAMTVAADATETLNVGSLVFDIDYRHPVVLAKQMATLDLASDGRVEFGLGAGWMTSDYEESGIPLDRPGVRIDRMEEGLRIMKALWADGMATLDGKHYKVTNAQGHPRPVSTPYPKIVIGGGGRRVLGIAAREADIVGINPSLKAGYVGREVTESAKPDRWRERIDWVKQAAGDRFDDIELQILTFLVQIVPSAQEVYEQFGPLFGMTPEELPEVPIGIVGTVDEVVELLQRRREELGFSYIVVHDQDIDAFAPVVERLTGT
jgi:probable F420-dependent oxidoreductase